MTVSCGGLRDFVHRQFQSWRFVCKQSRLVVFGEIIGIYFLGERTIINCFELHLRNAVLKINNREFSNMAIPVYYSKDVYQRV